MKFRFFTLPGLIALISNSLCMITENPLIQFCTSTDREPNVTLACFRNNNISHSKFEFGEMEQNTLSFIHTTSAGSRRLILRCQASYPVRWVTQRYVGRILQLSNGASIRASQSPLEEVKNLTFYQDIWIDNSGRGGNQNTMSSPGRILRCESFNDSSLASDLFIRRSDVSATVEFSASASANYFVTSTRDVGREDLFVVPCSARNFPAHITNVKLIETGRIFEDSVISDDCIECLCYAFNGTCESVPCENCGMIGYEYWVDSSPGAGIDHPTCVKDYNCSRQTVRGYMNRYPRDCNGDGIVTCQDFMQVHNHGFGDCRKDVYGNVAARYASCWSGRNLTVLDPSKISYDPRIGFRVTGSPNFTSGYTCSSVPTSGSSSTSSVSHLVQFVPLNPDLEVPNTLAYRRTEGDLICRTDTGRSMRGIRLMAEHCDNITDCDLRFRSTSNFNTMRQPTGRSMLGELKENDSFLWAELSIVNHGFVECSGVFQGSASKTDGYEFVKKVDYLFTGLDSVKYLTSQWFPTSAVINITKKNPGAEEDLRHEFSCTISTFVLLPNIRFGIQFQNGTRTLIPPISTSLSYGRPTVQQLAQMSEFAEWEWQMLINLEPKVKTVFCYAPWINSSQWAESEIPVAIIPGAIESAAVSVGVILGYCFAILAIIAVIVSLIVWYKYKKEKLKKRTLTEEEIEEFYKGNPNERKAPDGTVNVENMAFNVGLKIPSESLHTDNEVIGEGEFGVVYKGRYRDTEVAVKMTKSNADIDYFKAFLKEIKVMAYMGDHENIVKFFGAVVDDIKQRTCVAVIELSPFGSLHDFLRANSAGFSNTFSKDTLDESHGKLDSSYEHELRIKLNVLDLISFCEQIASGMEFMGRKKVIHGDLATRNVLVFENKIAKITDFGLSRKLYGCANYVKKQQAPLPWRWMAIETLRYLSFSSKSDVWAYGVTVWEIFTLAQVPFSALNWTLEFVDKLEAGLRLQKPNYAPQPVYERMLRCWDNSPEKRPTFSSLKAFFNNFKLLHDQPVGDHEASSPLANNVSHLHPLL